MCKLMDKFLHPGDHAKTILTTFAGSYNTNDLKKQTEAYELLLRGKNIAGKRIGVLVPQVFSYLSLVMAINQLGGIVVPLSGQYRHNDLKEILGFLDPHIVFTITSHGGFPFAEVIEAWAGSTAGQTLVIRSEDGFEWKESQFGDKEKPLEEHANSISFLCCTSGSTGLPKAMKIPMSSIEFTAQYSADLFELKRSDRLFLITPPTTVFGIVCLCAALKSGTEIVFPDSFELPLMVKLLQETNTNKIVTTPSIMKAIYMFAKQMAPEMIGNLEFCGLSGEPVTEDIVNQIPLNKSCRFVGLYGISEMGGVLYCDLHKKAEWFAYRGVEYCIDPDGELLIRTPGAFGGYYRQPELTAQVWTEDGWFKTGDLVQMNDNQSLRIFGRKKDMIKKGGQQVIPGEVEKVLLQHPNVKQAVVLGVPHAVFGEQIVAFTVLHEPLSAESLYPFCMERIARHKVPDVIEVVSAIPIVQGKADKLTLRNTYLGEIGGQL